MSSPEPIMNIDSPEEIKKKSNYSVLQNEATNLLKYFQLGDNTCEREFNGEVCNKSIGEDLDCGAIPNDLFHLQQMLADKLQENARLKQLNSSLSTNYRQKAKEIKELTNALTLEDQNMQNKIEISKYRDKVGRCNVEIQKLKRQTSTEVKKLNKERTTFSKLEKSHSRSHLDRKETGIEAENDKQSSSGKHQTNDKKLKELKFPDEKLDEEYLQKTLKIIKDESSIFEETLDEPSNLEFEDDI